MLAPNRRRAAAQHIALHQDLQQTAAYLMTTMSTSSKRLGTPGMVQPCTRLTCRSNSFLSCTLRLCVLVLCWESGVNSVPFMHTCTAQHVHLSSAQM